MAVSTLHPPPAHGFDAPGVNDYPDFAPPPGAPAAPSGRGARRLRSVRKQEIAEVTAQLAIMTRSGVDVTSALLSLASQCQRPALAEVLHAVHESVMAGSPLSNALARHPEVFSPTFIATVAAGEASGRMAEVLDQLAELQRNEVRASRSLRSLLTYPVLLVIVSASVLSALVVFVLPRFGEVFQQYDMSLPLITQALLGLAGELNSRWWLWGTCAAAAVTGFVVWRNTEGGRRRLDAFWLRGPAVRDVCQAMLVGRVCRLLGLMLDNGVPLLDSLRLTRGAVTNSIYRGVLRDLEDAVINGQGLATALQETDVLPRSAVEMLVTAERTGNLSEVARLLGDYYEEEASSKLRHVVGFMEPVITVVMGVFVAVAVLAVMLPVFDLSTFASGGG